MLASLQYAWEDSTITSFQSRFLPEHRIHPMSPTNFRRTRTATALLAAPLHLPRSWSTQNNAMLMWQAVEGHRNSIPVTLSSTSYRFNSMHNITLPRGYTLEAGGFYQSASLFGTIDFAPLWAINVGLQKTLRNKARITLAVNDVFDSLDWRWTMGSPGDPVYIDQLIDLTQRSISVTYSTRFGRGEVAEQRATASEEERRRAQQ